jgi:uncharacterized alpha-E superfamily protein
MGRYIERAENVARFIGVNLNLQLDLPLEPASQWRPLIDTSGDSGLFLQHYKDYSEENVIRFLAFDVRNPNSIYSCLRAARENARSIRDTISSEMWEQVNGLYLQIQLQRDTAQHQSLSEALVSIRLACHTFQGVSDATMSYNEAWHFLRLGKLIERAEKTSRILDVKYFILLPDGKGVGTPYDDIHWSAVLKSVSGFEMYRKKYGRISPRNIVDFLITDREFPRAIRHCIESAEASLHVVTGTPAVAFRRLSEESMYALAAEVSSIDVNEIIRKGLHEYLDALQTKMNAVGESLQRDFFVWQAPGVAHVAGAAR